MWMFIAVTLIAAVSAHGASGLTQLWQKTYPNGPSVVVGGQVVIVTPIFGPSPSAAFRIEDGSQLWTLQINSNFPVKTSPNLFFYQQNSSLNAYDIASCNKLWSMPFLTLVYVVSDIYYVDEHILNRNLANATATVRNANNGDILGVVSTEMPSNTTIAPYGGLVAVNSHLFFIISTNPENSKWFLHAVDAGSGALTYAHFGVGYYEFLIASDSYLVIVVDNPLTVTVYDSASGKLLWTFTNVPLSLSNIVLAGDVLVISDSKSIVQFTNLQTGIVTSQKINSCGFNLVGGNNNAFVVVEQKCTQGVTVTSYKLP